MLNRIPKRIRLKWTKSTNPPKYPSHYCYVSTSCMCLYSLLSELRRFTHINTAYATYLQSGGLYNIWVYSRFIQSWEYHTVMPLHSTNQNLRPKGIGQAEISLLTFHKGQIQLLSFSFSIQRDIINLLEKARTNLLHTPSIQSIPSLL